ncbi:hypothetical protein AKJ09_11086 [Labilithrix luteola]|uniref:Uncharacterized protein n=1 Tax=Labilithrix luteola TaxID=1391654 RepID=A0A0K1QFC3_9BACT|nr:hypothetical protein [Labilithrix luteola]AKV04423.1 hypothetical protein AKJ09_11086 [Labilithrix luteola]
MTGIRRTLVACASLVVPLGALAFHGCSEVEHDGAASDAAVFSPDRVTPADARTRDAPAHKPPPRPADIPDGWQLYEGYDPDCSFYIPTATDQFPAPLQWESCGPDLHPSDVACQRIAVNRDDPYEFLSSWVSATVASDGKLLFQVSKFTKPFVWRLVIDVDGHVRYGVIEADSDRCTLGGGYLWRDHYVLSLNELQSSRLEGYLIGELGALTPSFAIHRTEGGPHSLYTGPFGIVETGWSPDFLLYPWSALGSPRVLWTQDDGLNHAQFFFTDDAIFWTAGSYQGAKAKVWTEAAGVRDLVSFGTDQTRGAGAFGTDGVDMVWLEGAPRPPNDGGLDTYAITTAPYTTDPSQVRKRRLRSEVGSALSAERFQVGCGFAARSRHDGLRIVRIADGHSWFLPNKGTWNWQRVHAMNCDEIFVRVMNGWRADLVRIRLDSLGPGELPD